MATITPTTVKTTDPGVFNVYLVQWTAMGNADTGTAVAMTSGPDRSVQVEGTFASATVVIEGSNDGTNYRTLRDPQGNNLSFTAAGLKAVMELTRFIRASTSGGAGSSITVSLITRGQL